MASIRILATGVNTLAEKWLADCTGLYVPLYCSGVQFSGGLTVSMTLVARQRCELGACHEWGMSRAGQPRPGFALAVVEISASRLIFKPQCHSRGILILLF